MSLAKAAKNTNGFIFAAFAPVRTFRSVLIAGIEAERQVAEIMALIPNVTEDEVRQSIKKHGYEVIQIFAAKDSYLVR